MRLLEERKFKEDANRGNNSVTEFPHVNTFYEYIRASGCPTFSDDFKREKKRY